MDKEVRGGDTIPKVKICFNDACTEYILLDDGRTIIQPREKCDAKSISEDYTKQLRTIGEKTAYTIYADRRLFDVKAGDEIPLERIKKEKTK